MRKVNIILILLITFTIVLTSCSSDDGEPSVDVVDPVDDNEDDEDEDTNTNNSSINLQNIILGGGDQDDIYFGVAVAPDGDIVVCGQRDAIGVNGRTAFFERYTQDGTQLWTQSFTNSAVFFMGITQMENGDYIAVGQGNGGQRDAFAVRFNSEGNILWEQFYVGNQDELLNGVIALDDGGALLVGNTASTTGIGAGNNGSRDALAIRINASGNTIWSQNKPILQTEILLTLLMEE